MTGRMTTGGRGRGPGLVGVLMGLLVLAGPAAQAQATAEDRERLLRQRSDAAARAAADAPAPGLAIEDQTSAPPPEVPCFPITDINIEGVESLPSAKVRGLIAPYLNSCMGQLAVDSVLQVLTQAYLDRGLITSRAYLPPQERLAEGVLTIVVVEGRIEDVVLAEARDGAAVPGRRSRYNAAFPARPGDLLNLRDLEQGIDQINRVPSAQAQLDIAPGSDIGGSVLQIVYADTDPVRGRFELKHDTTETGSKQTASLGFDVDNLLGINDTFYLGLSGGENSNTLATSLSFPVGYLTVTANANYSESLSQLTATTELFEPATTASLTTSWLIARDDRQKTHLALTLAGSDNDRFVNGTALTPQKIRSAGLSYRFEHYGEGSYLATRLGFKLGHLTTGTAAVTPGAGPQARFGIWDVGITHQAATQNGMSLFTSFAAQYASGPLFSSQRMSIGGNTSLRGINGDSVSGDVGFTVSSELSVPVTLLAGGGGVPDWAARAAPYMFVDMGMVRDRHRNRKHAGIGIGAGARYQIGDTSEIDLFVGYPVLTTGSLSAKGPEIGLKISAKVF